MTPENKERLLIALRSGRYTQARGQLHDPVTGGYCCIGVACVELLNEKPNEHGHLCGQHATLGWKTESLLGINDTERARLEKMNDDGKSFSEIADYIEANL